jgi:hypothetical protein
MFKGDNIGGPVLSSVRYLYRKIGPSSYVKGEPLLKAQKCHRRQKNLSVVMLNVLSST